MTRKCVLCRETNYKNTYSFFSAPKDPETRKKWKTAIGINNYEVTDDTYVCSKHFTQNDIITHWVSGVPPHVITIKYKKCRLRPGAVPAPGIILKNNSSDVESNEYNNFEVNKESFTSFKKETDTASKGKEEAFSIPRENEGSSCRVMKESSKNDSLEVNEVYFINDCRERSPKLELLDSVNEQDYDATEKHEYEDSIAFETSHEDHEEMHTESESSESMELLQRDRRSLPSKVSDSAVAHPSKHSALSVDDDTFVEMWEMVTDDDSVKHIDDNNGLDSLKQPKENEIDNSTEHSNPDSKDQVEYEGENSDLMLFEDLLEVYTEIQLPYSWSCMVTSKGHTTTVVYLYMGMTKKGTPIVEKQVFVKSDMLLHCVVGHREIDPFMHDLAREEYDLKVRTLSNIEEFIEELDQRIVCEGNSNLDCGGSVNPSLMYRDGDKWRHTECPILVNNGSVRCSRCESLCSALGRGTIKNHLNSGAAYSRTLFLKEKKILTLQRDLKKMMKRNRRCELIQANMKLQSSDPRIFMDTISSLNMPEIQKLMIKECLKASMLDCKKNAKCSKTWVFLCVLLYVESPRMYKYMLLNNYMTLPSMCTIRKYLRQIKTDQQFYNLFQRTVEPFQPIEEIENEQDLS